MRKKIQLQNRLRNAATSSGNVTKADKDSSLTDQSTEDMDSKVSAGVMTRSKAKTKIAPSASALPRKSCLKTRKPE